MVKITLPDGSIAAAMTRKMKRSKIVGLLENEVGDNLFSSHELLLPLPRGSHRAEMQCPKRRSRHAARHVFEEVREFETSNAQSDESIVEDIPTTAEHFDETNPLLNRSLDELYEMLDREIDFGRRGGRRRAA